MRIIHTQSLALLFWRQKQKHHTVESTEFGTVGVTKSQQCCSCYHKLAVLLGQRHIGPSWFEGIRPQNGVPGETVTLHPLQ